MTPLFIHPPFPFSLLGLSGLTGATFAVLLASAAALALNVWFMERLLAVRIQVRPIATIALSAGLAFLAVSRLNAYISVSRAYLLVVALVLAFGVYGIVLIVTGS